MARSKIEPIDPLEPLEPAAELSTTWKRIRAGLLVEGGLVSGEVTTAWQEAVRDRDFDPDRCAAEILAEDPGPSVDGQLERRSGVLLRDLLMAPLTKGGRPRGQRRVKTGAAMLVSQLFVLVVWGGLFLVGVLVLRLRDISIDAFLDSLLSVFR